MIEIMGITGAAMLVGLGEVARRAVLGRRLTQALAEDVSTRRRPALSVRVLRSEAEVSDALERAIASEQASILRFAQRAQRYEAMRSTPSTSVPADRRHAQNG